ncbi:MAG: type II secretion system protein [Ignavibacteriaceae bacterium]|nr:MAG: type II secretion system F family protein [Chlorobiota bacterium]GJQ33189.1 MAG: type II secretion system protein [Ignavibacteriaceae bacterium]
MTELRFTAVKSNGQVISGSLTANSVSEGKKKIHKLAEQSNLTVRSIEKRGSYLYKVQKGAEKPIFGEQKAFNRQEVIDAFQKMGYKVHYVRSKLFDYQGKPGMQDLLMFVKISAELLDQKLPYGEILTLLINDTANKTLRETLKEINSELKKGTDPEQVFLRYQNVFGKFTAFMLGLAAKSGNMGEIYRATAKFLERRAEFKKNIKSALVTPLITVVVLFGAVLFYVMYIFPETANMFRRFGIELPPMTQATIEFSDFLIANPLLIFVGFLAPIIGIVVFLSTERGRYLKDKYMLRMPVIGSIVHKTAIEVFCRVFYTLYSGSAESITPLRISAEATDNKYFEDRIKRIAIPIMTKQGIGITDALTATGVFTETALSRLHSGEETGNIKNTMLQLANYYESETVYKLKNVIELIQVIISLLIMVVMTALTVVSAETATVSPKPPGTENHKIFLDKQTAQCLTPDWKLLTRSDIPFYEKG